MMKTPVIIYDKEEEEILGGLMLTDEQMKLLRGLQDNKYLKDRFIFIGISEIEYEEP